MHLVLSTTASQACVELAVQRFGEVRVDKIIFTKLDEAAHVGVVLNVVRRSIRACRTSRRARTCPMTSKWAAARRAGPADSRTRYDRHDAGKRTAMSSEDFADSCKATNHAPSSIDQATQLRRSSRRIAAA